MSFSTKVLVGLVSGLATGLFLGELVAPMKMFADGFIKLLQMTVLPYVTISIISSLGSLDAAEAKRLGLRVGAVLAGLWVVALGFAMLFPLAFPDRENATFFSTSLIEKRPAFNFIDLYIPSNPFPVLVSHSGNANPGFLKLVSNVNIPIIVPAGRAAAPDSIADSDPCKKVIVDFNKPHQQKFGEPANYYSAEMVDAVDIIAAALKVVPSAEGDKLRDAIEKTKGFVGMNGIYNFSPTDHHGTVVQDMMVLTIKDGKWQVLLK